MQFGCGVCKAPILGTLTHRSIAVISLEYMGLFWHSYTQTYFIFVKVRLGNHTSLGSPSLLCCAELVAEVLLKWGTSRPPFSPQDPRLVFNQHSITENFPRPMTQLVVHRGPTSSPLAPLPVSVGCLPALSK